MAEPIRIWLEIAHHAAFRAGGWAFVRSDGTELVGYAGGAGRAGADRVALEGLIAALKGQAPGRGVRLMTASPLVAALPVRIRDAAAGKDAPQEDLPLWAQAMTALGAAGVEVARAAAAPGTPTAFAASWAELARDKAKGGAFTSAIPKANLAKAGVA